MTAILIPPAILSRLRERRGLVEHVQRWCICCSRSFQSTGWTNRVCPKCREGKETMEFVK